MISFLLSACSAVGMYLLLTPSQARSSVGPRSEPRRRLLEGALRRAGLEETSPVEFIGASAALGCIAMIPAAAVFGLGFSTFLVGAGASTVPAFAWRRRRERRRRVAHESWPRMIEELRVLTGAAGKAVPQALLDVGLRGPEELRPSFLAAQREWALSTDFGRVVAVLKERLADPTADVILETLLIAEEVGGDLDSRLAALAEDRRQDELDRKDAAAKQSGARLARIFVITVPAGMALAGMNVGDGADAYRSGGGQILVSIGLTLVLVCWIWASRIMRLPESRRVFDR